MRFLAIAASLFVSLCAIPADRGTPPIAARAQILECDKNHYILLPEPCRSSVPAIQATIGYVGAVAVSPAGEVHFSAQHVIYRIDRSGALVRVAGTGAPGLSGDGGPATSAQLNFPQWYPDRVRDPIDWSELVGPLAFDARGNLFVGDALNNRVRRIGTNGVIETVLANAWLPQGVAVDRDGNLYVADGSGVLARIAPDGSITGLIGNDCGNHHLPGLCAPQGMVVDPSGRVYVADGYCRVQRVEPPYGVTTVAGRGRPDGRGWAFTCGYTGDGPADDAALEGPFAVAFDPAGNLVIADTYNHCIRRVDAAGMLTTIAGRCGVSGFDGDGGSARDAKFYQPHGVAADPAGNIYIADTENFRVRRIDANGIITTIAGNGDPGCELVPRAWGIRGCAEP